MLETRSTFQQSTFAAEQSTAKPKASNPARRSLNIFKKTAVDNNAEPVLTLGSRSYTAPFTSSGPTSSKNKGKKAKGTVVNAVPQVSSIVDVAPSSQQGQAIRSRKTESSPLDFACATATEQASTLREAQDIAIRSSKQKRSSKSSHTEERIGVWVDGIIHWDATSKTRSSWGTTSDSSTLDRFLDLRERRHSEGQVAMHAKKPSLTVVIPDGELTESDNSAGQYPPELKRPATSHIPPRPKTSGGSSRRRKQNGFPVRDVSPMGSESTSPRKSGSIRTAVFTPVEGHSRAASSASQRVDPSRSSSTASSAAAEKDDRSQTSPQSSSTSIDGGRPIRTVLRHKVSPASPFVDDDHPYTPVTRTYAHKPLPAIPGMADMMRLNPLPPPLSRQAVDPPAKRPQTSRGPTSAPSTKVAFGKPPRRPSTLRHMKSVNRLDQFDEEFMKSSPWIPENDTLSTQSSPTLSKAEDDLEEHLESMTNNFTANIAQPKPKDSGLGLRIAGISPLAQSALLPPQATANKRCSVAIVMQPPGTAPTSDDDDWSDDETAANNLPVRRLSDPSNLMTPTDDAPPGDWWNTSGGHLSRCMSSPTLPKFHQLPATVYRKDKPFDAHQNAIDDGLIVVTGPMVHRAEKNGKKSGQTQQSAEGVLLRILSASTSIHDLMNTVVINRGMYRVYQENKLKLLKRVTFNYSAAQWELMEWRPPHEEEDNGSIHSLDLDDDEVSIPPHDAASYLATLKQNIRVVAALKTKMLAQCTGFIRKDTVAAMVDYKHPAAQRVSNAFWRIWSFCTIFGCQKGRDEDMSGQLDWLKGGRLANNLDCAATVITNFEFDVGSILLNAPEHFGQGNTGGLTADKLYDITEVWTCMATLLQGYLGRVDQAREFGVYDNCSVPAKDTEKAEHMLEEWIAWVVTLGPTVVLELAELAADTSSAGFALAKKRGWTKWAPPTQTQSRVTFLKEPVARLYEERVTMANTKARDAREQEEKDKSRRRIAAHAEEIRMRRQNSAFKRVPLVDMSMERPMSILSTISGGGMLTPRWPPPQMELPPMPAMPNMDRIHPAFRGSPSLAPPASTFGGFQSAGSSPPLGSKPTPPAVPLRAPTPEERVDGASREALRAFNGSAESTVEIAIKRITGMGFTEAQAKHALKVTDTGDGLRVDRAVELLLRSQ